MVRHGVLVCGPAGCGKSTLCSALQQHMHVSRRAAHAINLDPAAEYVPYDPVADIRELIRSDDAASELNMGPNGSLVFCIEFLEENSEWLEEKVAEIPEDDLLLFDLPGQVELYIHVGAMRQISRVLETAGVRLCVAYCLDITFLSDAAKMLSGSLLALNAMLYFELPHVNILTKCDLADSLNIVLKRTRAPSRAASRSSSSSSSSDDSDDDSPLNKGQWAGRSIHDSAFARRTDDADADQSQGNLAISALLEKTPFEIVQELDEATPAGFRRLHYAFASLLDEFGLVNYFPVNLTEEESLTDMAALFRTTLQADEDEEPRMEYDFGVSQAND